MLKVGGLFFLKRMTLAGFVKVTFFALLSPQILPVEEEGTPFQKNLYNSKAEKAHTLWERTLK